MLSTIAVRLLTVSDLEHSYLLRGNSRIPLNVQQILYGNDAQGAQRLQAGDTILIPFSQRFVSVSGGVARSGVFAYVPDKTANYYIALAGGLSDDASYPASVKVYDRDGKRADGDAPVMPESTIVVAKNTFVKDIAPTVAIIGLVSSIIGIVAAVVNILVDSKSL
jgi:protein involved in polysaccharide export with SLBB domain